MRTSHINGVIIDGEDILRKRPATEDLEQPSKKRKAEEPIIVDPAISAAFLLETTNPLALFDAKQIPVQFVVEIIIKAMEILPPQMLEDRLNVALL